MTGPLFSPGDRVRVGRSTTAAEAFLDTIKHAQPAGLFEVVAVLPKANGQVQYRLWGGSPARERIVHEDQIVPASKTKRRSR